VGTSGYRAARADDAVGDGVPLRELVAALRERGLPFER
jgi:hypothetical protein